MSKTRKIGLIIFVLIVLITAIGAYFYIQINDGLEALDNIVVQDVQLTDIEDGIYVGEYSQTPISVIVEVEVIDKQITSINILQHSNGQGEPAELILDTVIQEQSLDVDSIAGATYSSKVILLAISDALS